MIEDYHDRDFETNTFTLFLFPGYIKYMQFTNLKSKNHPLRAFISEKIFMNFVLRGFVSKNS